MPFIYTMYIPQEDMTPPSTVHDMVDANAVQMLKHLLIKEFDGTREEVVDEVRRAPDRSTDNLICDLKKMALHLKMHCELMDGCRRRYVWMDRLWKGITISIGLVGISLTTVYIIRTVGRTAPLSATPSAPSLDSLTEIVDTVGKSNPKEWKQQWVQRQREAKVHCLKYYVVYFLNI